MRIIKGYNNSVVLSKNENNEEVILVGSGIAFGLHKGDEIDMSKVEKIYAISLKEDQKNKYEKMVKDVPVEVVLVTEEIVSYIKGHCTKKITDSIYITLTDHIVSTIDRIESGIEFDEMLVINTKLLYHEEFLLALHAVEILREKLKINVEDSEANFIALHIVVAEMDSNMAQLHTFSTIISQIVTILDKHFEVDKKTIDFDRFLTHCRFFVQRVLDNEQNGDKGLLAILKDKSFSADSSEQALYVKEISEMIYKNYNYKVSNDEKVYLLIHLYKLTK